MKIGIIQYKPVFNNLSTSIEKAIGLIHDALAQKCEMVIFGETWFCGYPAWLDYAPGAGLWNNSVIKELFAEMHANSLSIASMEMDQLRKLSKEYHVTIGFGFNEVVKGQPGHGSIYNSFGLLSEGELVIHHRKLMPTFTEKLLYAHGDGAGLISHPVKNVRVGGLICWEHWMPLARQALHNTGEHIHLALWPRVHEMHQIASRQYAFEGRCYVIAVGQILSRSDLPDQLDYSNFEGDILDGGSCVIGPDGQYVLSPVHGKEALIVTDLDLAEIKKEQMTLDVSGHYQRPDIFDFSLNKERK
jgi:predicted amidohydrolase